MGPVLRYERTTEDKYFYVDNFEYLKNTEDKLLFIHSKDDKRVKYKSLIFDLNRIENPNITLMTVNEKKHNPTYTVKAVNYLDYCFKGYMKLIKKKASLEERKKFMKDKSIHKMTELDRDVMKAIVDYIG